MKKTITLFLITMIFIVFSACTSQNNNVSTSSISSNSGTSSNDKETLISGTIEDGTMNTITIKTKDGQSLYFSTVDADKSKCKGLIIGSEVKIYYTGEIIGTDTSKTKVIRMEQDEETSSNPNESQEKLVAGEIIDNDGKELKIKTSEGQELTFNIVGADSSKCSGMTIGQSINVYYTGEITNGDTSSVTVTRLTQDSNQSNGNTDENLITGTIVDNDGKELKIKTDNEKELTFNIVGADSSKCSGMTIGQSINIYYTGEITNGDTSSVTVTRLTQ